jgi:hypothetical protein
MFWIYAGLMNHSVVELTSFCLCGGVFGGVG